jgi:uncharacterized repeat protein (TIGR01451 family)
MVFNYEKFLMLCRLSLPTRGHARTNFFNAAAMRLLLLTIFLLPAAVNAQTFLDFSGTPTLETGTALQQGARYRYANVLPGIDGLVTLATFSAAGGGNASVTLVTLDAPGSAAPGSTTGSPDRFQPVIECTAPNNNRECWIRFNFTFVLAGTNTPATLYGVVVASQDTDGANINNAAGNPANGIREFVEFVGANVVTLGIGDTASPTTPSTLVAGTAVQGGTRRNQISSANGQAGIGTQDKFEAYANYTSPITGFSVVGGNIIGPTGCVPGATVCPRQNSWSFRPVDASQPSITIRKISNGGIGTFSFTGTNDFVTQPIETLVAGTAVTSQSEALRTVGQATTITESAPAGFALQSITCTTGSGTATPTVNGTAGGNVVLSAAAIVPGNDIVCTFTNRKLNADLVIAKTNSVAGLTAGNTTTYSIVATNNGPDAAPGTVITDTASAGLDCTTTNVTCSSAAPATGVCPSASFPFSNLSGAGVTLTAFPNGASATLTVTCTVTATGF